MRDIRVLSFLDSPLLKIKIIKHLLFFIVLFLAILFVDKESKYLILLDSFIKVLLFQLFLFVPGFYFLKILNKRYFTNNISFLLSCSASIFAFGLIFIILQIFKSPLIFYPITNGILIIILIAAAYRLGLLGEIFKVDRVYKYGFLLILIGTTIALCFVSVNTNLPKEEIYHCSIVSERGLLNLAQDNEIPYLGTLVFNTYSAPWASHFWTMGDRPPLMSVVNSIWALSILKKEDYSYWYYQIISTVLNILFLLPCAVLAQQIFRDTRVSYKIPVAVFLNVFIFINIFYTWPKLMGAYFVLASISFVLNKRINFFCASVVGILWGLAALSHGGVILSLPVLLLLSMIFWIKLKQMKFLIPFVVFLLLVQSPWIIYKKVHSQIDTNHLIYHYIPTEIFPGDPIRTVKHFLEEHPAEEQLKYRTQNIKNVVQMNKISRAFKSLLSGNLLHYYKEIDDPHYEFKNPIVAFGEFQILLSIPVLLYFFLAYFLFNKKEYLSHFKIKHLTFFLSFVVLSYLFNIFIKWDEIVNHALPYVEFILGIMLVSGISFSLLKPVRILSFILILIRFGYYVVATSLRHGFPLFDFFNIAVILGVVAVVFISQYYAKQDQNFG